MDNIITKVGIEVYKDGDKWCAVYENFVNLQESVAGFGDSPLGAIDQLFNQQPLEHFHMLKEEGGD